MHKAKAARGDVGVRWDMGDRWDTGGGGGDTVATVSGCHGASGTAALLPAWVAPRGPVAMTGWPSRLPWACCTPTQAPHGRVCRRPWPAPGRGNWERWHVADRAG